ncbi:MAG TPA: glycosyltransferase family 2 protein [Gemmataceae bacterium]|jgi:glycosyltransferase involved in cell wall biosynthesis|nr:glycosyltransferase family 2 protein [Gemmataceae bacterium]
MFEANERAPIAQAAISVVLPTHNAASALPGVIEAWTGYLDSLSRDYELLVIDDGSTDGTGPLADELSTRWSRLKVVHHAQPQGLGACLRAGLALAQFPLFCYVECSTAYQARDLAKLLDVMDHVDLVTGLRIWQDHKPGWSAGRLWSWLALRFVFGLRLKDVECAFKLFRRSIFERIPIQSAGSFVHAEILAKANFLGCMMAEVEVSYAPQAGQSMNMEPQGQRRREAFRLFRHPDFGPSQPASATTSQTATSSSEPGA